MRAASSWGCACFSEEQPHNRLAARPLKLLAFKFSRAALVFLVVAVPILTGADKRLNIDELSAAVRQHPEDTRTQLTLGLALLRSGQLQEARSPLLKAANNPALAEEARFLLGADYFESHDGTAALKSLKGLEHGQHAERVLYMLEECFRSLGRTDEARAAFHDLNTRFPDGAWMHLLMASAYESQAQPERAIEEYKSALGKDAAMPNARFAVGYLYWRQGELEEARRWLQEETSVTACHSLANYYLGEIARTERDLREAEAHYRKAIVCDSRYGDAHLRLGTVLSENNHPSEALTQLQIAAKLMPTQSSPHYQMATLYRRLGQNGKAESEFQTVRSLKAKAGQADEKLVR